MPTIRVTAKQLYQSADYLQEMNQTFRTQISNLQNSATNLSAQWQGEANKAFMSAFNSDFEQCMNFAALMDKYVISLQTIAKNYEIAEARAAAIANSRTYADIAGGISASAAVGAIAGDITSAWESATGIGDGLGAAVGAGVDAGSVIGNTGASTLYAAPDLQRVYDPGVAVMYGAPDIASLKDKISIAPVNVPHINEVVRYGGIDFPGYIDLDSIPGLFRDSIQSDNPLLGGKVVWDATDMPLVRYGAPDMRIKLDEFIRFADISDVE